MSSCPGTLATQSVKVPPRSQALVSFDSGKRTRDMLLTNRYPETALLGFAGHLES